MHKVKVQQFKKQIRRQYLNSYFKKNRKQFADISMSQSNQHATIQKLRKQLQSSIHDNKMSMQNPYLSLHDIQSVAKLSQTLHGIQCLSKSDIPIVILPYLQPSYYNTQQQRLATCVFANITFIRPQKIPNKQFLRNVTNIIENADTQKMENNRFQDMLENSLMIMYHLMIQFQQVIRFYVQECQIVKMLFRMFQAQVSQNIIQKLLKIMTILKGYWHRNSIKDKGNMRKFLKFYITILQNTNHYSLVYLSLYNMKSLLYLYTDHGNCYQQDSGSSSFLSSTNGPFIQYLGGIHQKPTSMMENEQQQLRAIQRQIQKSKVLQKLASLYPYIKTKSSITRQLLQLVKFLMGGLERQTIKQKVMRILSLIYDVVQSCEQSNTRVYDRQSGDSTQHYDEGNININTNANANANANIQQQQHQLKISLYQNVYLILCTWSSDHDLLVESQLFQKLQKKFSSVMDQENSDFDDNSFKKQIFRCLIFVFGMLFYSDHLNNEMKDLLKRVIKKVINQQGKFGQGDVECRNQQQDSQIEQFYNFVENLQKFMNDTLNTD